MIGDMIDTEDMESRNKLTVMVQNDTSKSNGTFIVTPSSPFGKALLGKKIGDIAEIYTLKRKLILRIVDIRFN
ncbi:MAG: GreA/GreB family elongation factor [Prevotella sp.]|nr:GreA/GreB family elongation factor [Prevotella sp.]